MTEATCPRCYAPLTDTESPEGLCPKCLLAVAMGEPEVLRTGTGAIAPPPPSPAELAPFFPQLEILEIVGRGGMGVVYKARQRELDRLVALKILNAPEVAGDPTFEERFQREARALASLSHENIVAIYDSGRAGEHYYFVMEFADGPNLRQVIRSGELKPEQAMDAVRQICAALAYAHGEGVVHRDIKPENVLLSKKGRVKIADFGLAKLLGRAPNMPTLTGTHQAMGTLHYMAPEQIEHPLEVDHRADIYSLGVVFYELLTGELPIGLFQPPSGKVAIDVRLDQVVLKTLEKEPERRYQAAGEMQTDLDHISSTEAPAKKRASAAGKKKSKNHKIVAGIGCCALIMFVPLGMLFASWIMFAPVMDSGGGSSFAYEPWDSGSDIVPAPDPPERFGYEPHWPMMRGALAAEVAPPGLALIDGIARSYFQRYLELERAHRTTHVTSYGPDAPGDSKEIVKISAFPLDLEELERSFHESLQDLVVRDVIPALVAPLDLQELFPFGREPAEVTIWKEQFVWRALIDRGGQEQVSINEPLDSPASLRRFVKHRMSRTVTIGAGASVGD